MHEDVEMAAGAHLDFVRDKPRSLLLQLFNCVGEVFDSEGNVVQAFAALLHKLCDDGVGAGGFQQLKATFANENLKLWPGQFVNARLLLDVRTNGVVVPASVVQRGPDGAYAFIVDENMKAKMAAVKVAQIEGGQALIDSGLQPGQRVVVDGQYKLQPGSTVRSSQTEGTPTGRTNASPAAAAKKAATRKS